MKPMSQGDGGQHRTQQCVIWSGQHDVKPTSVAKGLPQGGGELAASLLETSPFETNLLFSSLSLSSLSLPLSLFPALSLSRALSLFPLSLSLSRQPATQNATQNTRNGHRFWSAQECGFVVNPSDRTTNKTTAYRDMSMRARLEPMTR